jgi:hypothetical protein
MEDGKLTGGDHQLASDITKLADCMSSSTSLPSHHHHHPPLLSSLSPPSQLRFQKRYVILNPVIAVGT